MQDNEQMLSSFLDLNERFIEYWRRNPVADCLEAFGIPWEKCFGERKSLPNGFWIVKVQSDGFNQLAAPVAVFPWDEWLAVRDALGMRALFKWGLTHRHNKSEHLYLFGSSLWSLTKADAGYTPDQLLFVFCETLDRERRKDERRKALHGTDEGKATAGRRKRIPAPIRNAVWVRDNGRCANCGATENLQFDHIISLAKGGSQSVANIELLCDLCNQTKGPELS